MNLTNEARRICARNEKHTDPYMLTLDLLHDLSTPITPETIRRARSAINRAIARPTATRGGARPGTGPKRVNWKCKTCGEVRTNAQYIRMAVCDICADTEFEQVKIGKEQK